MLQELLTVIS